MTGSEAPYTMTVEGISMSTCRVAAFIVLATALALTDVAGEETCVERVGRWPYGPALADEVLGGTVLFSSGAVLGAVDVSSPGDPVVLDRLDLDGVIRDISVSGDRALVAVGPAGLSIVDAASPSQLEVVGVANGDWSAERVAAGDDLALVAAGDAGLRVVDLIDPSEPVEIGAVTFSGPAMAVAAGDGVAFVAAEEAGLRVVDLSVPEQPVELGALTFGVSSDTWAQRVVVLDEGRLVVGLSRWLVVVDVADPAAPVELGRVRVYLWPVKDIAVDGDLAVVANHRGGLRVFDLSSPAEPCPVGWLDPPGWAFGVASTADFAYLADYHGGLQIVDLHDPSLPVIAGAVATSGTTEGIAAAGGIVYSSSGPGSSAAQGETPGGLRIFDADTEGSYTEIGFEPVEGYPGLVEVADDHAYVANGGWGVNVIDVSEPTQPVAVGSLGSWPWAYETVVRKGRAYVAFGDGGVRVFDVTDPAAAVEIGGYAADETHALSIALAGDLVVLGESGYDEATWWGLGVRLLDATDPGALATVGYYATPGLSPAPVGLVGAPGRLFAAVEDEGLRVVDIRDPSNLAEVGHFATDGWAIDVAAVGRCVAVGDDANGLTVLGGWGSNAPSERGAITTSAPVVAVETAGRLVYVAEGEGGFEVFDLSGCGCFDYDRADPPEPFASSEGE